jgi:hypothetical protein
MPYAIRKRGNKWVVINKETGKVKGTHSSREKAAAQMRLLYGIESEKWKPTFSSSAMKRAVSKK